MPDTRGKARNLIKAEDKIIDLCESPNPKLTGVNAKFKDRAKTKFKENKERQRLKFWGEKIYLFT